jgi:pimeloyl-ACP methyl ester carboxylesterase
MTGERNFIDVAWNGRRDRIEYAWVAPQRRDQPLLVFLHEGLGSLTMWRDFPWHVCEAAGCRGLVFSRWGYGQSSPRAGHEKWPVDFMHHQARDFLPAFFEALGLDSVNDKPWLYGHSDGGSIALIHAASFPERVAGIVVAAPHTFVEDISIASIENAKDGYVTTDLRSKLTRYHADPDSAFWGWNDIWLDPRFESWTIESLLPSIRSPVLAIQGVDDEYGTMAQIDGIAAALPGTRLLKLQECGHSAHRDQPEQVISATIEFIAPMRSP